MPRIARVAPGGSVFHVLNRANGKLTLFRKDDDYLAFERVLVEAHRRVPVRLLDWCLMPNHWHMVLWPRRDGELSAFIRWLTLTHAQRWKAAHGAVGHGHLYQGRFKSFVVAADSSLSAMLRYVQRNPLRAKLVRRAERWRWGSCRVRAAGPPQLAALLSEWPIETPRDWLAWVNAPQTDKEVEALRTSLRRGRPYGGEAWVLRTARRLGLEQTLRPPGRPAGWRQGKGRKDRK